MPDLATISRIFVLVCKSIAVAALGLRFYFNVKGNRNMAEESWKLFLVAALLALWEAV